MCTQTMFRQDQKGTRCSLLVFTEELSLNVSRKSIHWTSLKMRRPKTALKNDLLPTEKHRQRFRVDRDHGRTSSAQILSKITKQRCLQTATHVIRSSRCCRNLIDVCRFLEVKASPAGMRASNMTDHVCCCCTLRSFARNARKASITSNR